MKLAGKKLILVILAFTYFSIINAQTENIEKESAFSYELFYIGDVIANMHGGIQTGYRYLGMANISIGFDTEKAGLWKGGEFYINGANTHGGEPTGELIGDFQGVSNIEAGDLTYMHELWFKQSIKNLSLIVGLQDLNAEYAANDFGDLYINSSFGIHSTIADNVPSPIFPLTRLGATLLWDISNKFTVKAAVYDGLRHDYENNDYNLNWDLNSEDGILYVSEFQYSGNLFKNKKGIYKIGFYNHNHKFTTTNADIETTKIRNNMGFYFVANQMVLTHANRDGGLGVFTQLGLSSPHYNNHFRYVGFGLNYCGISDNRCNDEIGIAVAHTHFKTSITGNETVIELSYKATMGDHIFIQPDIQYVINLSGTGVPLDNAFAGILRFGINF